MRLLNLLFRTDNVWSFDRLKTYILKLRESNVYPFAENLPQGLTFPKDFWNDLIKIFRDTNTDGLERAFSVFWADGEVIFTKVKTGSDRMVKSGGAIQVKYSQHPTKGYYARKDLFVDGKLTKKRDVYHKSIPKSIEIQYLFNIHTHPKHTTKRGDTYYNFFSVQDIKSLISSKAIITGLVTDKLWILIRTDKSPSSVDDIPEVLLTPEYVEKKLHMRLYEGDFRMPVNRYQKKK
ncbi:hypothetical protein GX888_00440 [Candidatus Dojkabacteria bacterium]|uniref:Uncharacterized protein n=1 Tax=Candidatus Dojkabacteria bacterium TaxID=2099670 RepID=A0A847VCB8_9BACT|nr:hypothetical protein [Candidatus Dojkabacteria bacterium]